MQMLRVRERRVPARYGDPGVELGDLVRERIDHLAGERLTLGHPVEPVAIRELDHLDGVFDRTAFAADPRG